MNYRITHTIDEGIERIVYTPRERRFAAPLLMQHGMWHGAWCWRSWQELLAEWGWESHAFSLPGHGKSLPRRHHRWCTLQYYHGFLNAEISRMSRAPVVLGHSMGGALTQWYLRRADLPAAVLVASWPSRNMLPNLFHALLEVPVSLILGIATLSASPAVRTPRAAAELFLTEGSIIDPEEFHGLLSPESLIILFQHMPPFWRPNVETATPLLWLAGTDDVVTPERMHRASARDYGADYHTVPEGGHDLMLDRSYRTTAAKIHTWLVDQGVE